MTRFLELAARRDVVRRALRIALIVGTLLVGINHGDRIFSGSVEERDLLKMFITYFVPYGVSTVSSVMAIREREKQSEDK